MPSMSEFLSGFSYSGQPVVQTGVIDPMGPDLSEMEEQLFQEKYPDWEDTGLESQAWKTKKMKAITKWLNKKGFGGPHDPVGLPGVSGEDFDYGGGPRAYARLLQDAEMEGGVLSGTMQNQQFAEQTSGLMSLLGGQDRDRQRTFAAQNIGGVFAQRIGDNAQFQMGQTLGGLRAGFGAQHASDLFNAKKGFTDMLTETSIAEKQFVVNTSAAMDSASKAAKAQKQAGLMAGLGSLAGGALAFAGGGGGGSGGTAAGGP